MKRVYRGEGTNRLGIDPRRERERERRKKREGKDEIRERKQVE